MTTVKPILFNGDMVRAILEGRKTQTRRIIKPQPTRDDLTLSYCVDSTCSKDVGKYRWCKLKEDGYSYEHMDEENFRLPYGQTGGALWLRENWVHGADFYGPEKTYYKADHKNCEECENKTHKWKPSIHMPRWASRITLEIKDIRVERLNIISDCDVIAEGIDIPDTQMRDMTGLARLLGDRYFKPLWCSINGADSWQENPWVWVVEFKHHEMNIDKYLERLAA